MLKVDFSVTEAPLTCTKQKYYKTRFHKKFGNPARISINVKMRKSRRDGEAVHTTLFHRSLQSGSEQSDS